jgi:RNA polymerase sigma-70 factor (ECF subfamily)
MLYCAAQATTYPEHGQTILKQRAQAASASPAEIDRIRSLDTRSVGEIHDRYYPAVYRYARFRLGDDQHAEDLASEVFIRLIEAVQRGKGPRTSIQGWLMATASNLAADHYRRSYRYPHSELPEELPASGPLPDDLAARSELGGQLQQALASLTPDQQHVITLRFGAGLSLEETAASLGKEANAIKALQFRALAALRRTMGEDLA